MRPLQEECGLDIWPTVRKVRHLAVTAFGPQKSLP